MPAVLSPIGVDLTRPTSDARFRLGEICKTADGQEYIYVQDNGSALTQYAFVAVDEAFAATELTTALALVGHYIGIAQVAFTASYYGWVAVKGSDLTGLTNAAVAVDTQLYTTATAGKVDDASSTQVAKLENIVPDTATTQATSTTFLIKDYINTDGYGS